MFWRIFFQRFGAFSAKREPKFKYNAFDWVRSFSRKSRAFSGKSRAFLENARLFPSWSSFSRLKKKPGIFQKCPAFSKDARLFNHTGYSQYVLKKPGMFQYIIGDIFMLKP
jgi:hypothetical protein